MGLSDADLPSIIECPKCGAKNMRTESFCSNCDTSLVELKEKMLADIAKARGSEHRPDPFADEKRQGVIPRARTIQFSGLGQMVMEGRLVLTDKRMLYAAFKAGHVKTMWGIAGAKGGLLGTIASAGALKTRVGGPNDSELAPDMLLRAFEGNFQLPYEVITKVEGEVKRDELVLSIMTKGIYPFTPEKAIFTFVTPEEMVKEYSATGMSKDQAARDYSDRCRILIEKTLLSAKVDISWISQ